MKIAGILNVTRDSFSDGGRFFEPGAALRRASELMRDGASLVDVGAESTHPDSEDVPADEEIRRLQPVVKELVRQGVPVSVDTHKAAVMRHALDWGAAMINDVSAMKDPDAVSVLAGSDVPVVIMHSRSSGVRAERRADDSRDTVGDIIGFFQRRMDELGEKIDRARLVLDPGMGFFLGDTPQPSLAVLNQWRRLKELGQPLYLCTSRKSFIGTILDRPPQERGSGTLATELFAYSRGVDYIRTHDVRALHDATRMWDAMNDATATGRS